jgi:TIGR03009 family protein
MVPGTILAVVLLVSNDPLPKKESSTPVTKSDARQEAVLREWEQKSKGWNNIQYKFKGQEEDATFKTKEIIYGEVAGAWPDLVRIDLTNEAKTPIRTVLFSKDQILEYDPPRRQKRVFDLAKRDQLDWVSNIMISMLDGVRPLYLWPPVCELQQRFRITLSKEDQHYAYLRIEPRSNGDRNAFRWILVALAKETFLVRTIILAEPNGNTRRWDIEQVKTNVSPPITVESLSKNLPQNCEEIVLPSKK